MTISRTKKLAGVAAAASIALALAGCGSAPEETDPTGDAGDVVEGFTPCLVSDDGGFNDKSFNQSALMGMEKASDELGVEFIEVDQKLFYDATAPVRAKYGAPYAELIKRIEAVK